MSKYLTNYSASYLLKNLADKNLTVDEDISDFIINQQQEKNMPIYQKILLGIGALISSAYLIFFLFTSNIIDYNHHKGLIIWGLAFIAGAFGLQQIAGDKTTIKHSFFIQTSLSFMIAGKLLFIYGVTETLDSSWGASLGIFIISLVTYPFYRVAVDRFLSALVFLVSILLNTKYHDTIYPKELLLSSFFLFQIIGSTFLLIHPKIKQNYTPLAYAFALSLAISVLLFTSETKFLWEGRLFNPIFINTALTCWLITIILNPRVGFCVKLVTI